jgi:hypothetical protein
VNNLYFQSQDKDTTTATYCISFDKSESALEQGCQIFLGTKYQNGKNIPNYHKPYQLSVAKDGKMDHHLLLQDPPKFTQIGIFGLKTIHLATP